MHGLELSLSDLASLVNVTEYYLLGVSVGEENFSLEFLYRVMNAVHGVFDVRLVPIWEDETDLSIPE